MALHGQWKTACDNADCGAGRGEIAMETFAVARLDILSRETAASAAPPAAITEIDSRLHAEIAAARGYRAQAKAANTLRASISVWNQFEESCDERSLEPLSARPEAVTTKLASLACPQGGAHWH